MAICYCVFRLLTCNYHWLFWFLLNIYQWFLLWLNQCKSIVLCTCQVVISDSNYCWIVAYDCFKSFLNIYQWFCVKIFSSDKNTSKFIYLIYLFIYFYLFVYSYIYFQKLSSFALLFHCFFFFSYFLLVTIFKRYL